MKFSVCTDAVYRNTNTASAIEAVKALGFDAVEFWSWEDKDVAAIVEASKKYNVDIVAICTRFVPLNDASRRDEYVQGLIDTISVSKQLGNKLIISQVGQDNGLDEEEQFRSIVEGLKACAAVLEEADMTLVIEPLNTRVDHKGYFLSSSTLAANIIEEVSSPYVKLVFDIYHQQVTEGDVTRRSLDLLDKIGHFHAAGNPGRGELDRGELNYEAIFMALLDGGYKGHFGLEYIPKEDAAVGLRRLREQYK